MTSFQHTNKFLLKFALISCLISTPAAFATLYKTTDADGNVSFSDTHTEVKAGSKQETINTPAPTNTLPSSASQLQQERNFMQDAESRNANLSAKWNTYDSALKEAKAQLKMATEELEGAKVPVEGDRVFTKTATGGFSRETPQRKERIVNAKQGLVEAKKALNDVRKLKPQRPRPAKPFTFEPTVEGPR